MLRLCTRLWEPRNAGRGKPRTCPTDPALAQAITDWRADLGLAKVPLPAPVVGGSGESVDLVYLDPPFNSNQDYNVLFKESGGERSE